MSQIDTALNALKAAKDTTDTTERTQKLKAARAAIDEALKGQGEDQKPAAPSDRAAQIASEGRGTI